MIKGITEGLAVERPLAEALNRIKTLKPKRETTDMLIEFLAAYIEADVESNGYDEEARITLKRLNDTARFSVFTLSRGLKAVGELMEKYNGHDEEPLKDTGAFIGQISSLIHSLSFLEGETLCQMRVNEKKMVSIAKGGLQ